MDFEGDRGYKKRRDIVNMGRRLCKNYLWIEMYKIYGYIAYIRIYNHTSGSIIIHPDIYHTSGSISYIQIYNIHPDL